MFMIRYLVWSKQQSKTQTYSVHSDFKHINQILETFDYRKLLHKVEFYHK